MFNSCLGPLTEEDNGRTIELSEDTPFEVQLKGDPGSLLVWKPIQYDKTVIKLFDVPEVTEEDSNGEVYKVFSFEFQTVADGETRLVMVYIDPENMQEPPAKTFEIRIICGTMGRIEAN